MSYPITNVTANSFTISGNLLPCARPVTEIITGITYQIVYVGSTDFTLIGAASNTVGTEFTATGPGTGTGRAKVVNCVDNPDVLYEQRPFRVSGTSLVENAGSFEIGKTYTITTTGTTDFTLIGAASNTPGTEFVATGPGTGTGTATYRGNDGTYLVLSTTFTPTETTIQVLSVPDPSIGYGQVNVLPTTPYQIDFTDPVEPPFNIAPGNLNTGDTTLALPGPGLFNYGESMVENLIHLLENFSSNSSPLNPIKGQLWYDSANETLKVCTDPTGPIWTIANEAAMASTYVQLAGDTMTGPLVVNDSADNLLTLSRTTVGLNKIKIDHAASIGWDVGLNIGGEFAITNNSLTADSLTINDSDHLATFNGNVVVNGTTGAPSDIKAGLIVDTFDATENALQVKVPLSGTATLAFGVGVNPRKGMVQYNSSNDSLALATGGGSVVIDSQGYVGIQSGTPTAPLQIGSSIYFGEGAGNPNIGPDIHFSGDGLTSSDNNMYINFGGTGVVSNLYVGSGAHTTGATNHMTIKSTGEVGIGTILPQNKLHVHDTGTGANYLQITNGATGFTTGNGVVFGLDTNENMMLWSYEANNIVIGNNNGEVARISNTGNFGIGAPPIYDSRLHIHDATTSSKIRITHSTTGTGFTDGAEINLNGTLLSINNHEGGLIFGTDAGIELISFTGGGSKFNHGLQINEGIRVFQNSISGAAIDIVSGILRFASVTGTIQMSNDVNSYITLNQSDRRFRFVVDGNEQFAVSPTTVDVNTIIDINSNRLANVGTPTAGTDGMSRDYADNRYQLASNVDIFLKDVGDGSDGTFNSIGASTISKVLSQYTTFTLNAGHTLTIDTPWAIIKSTNSITIDGTINMRGVDIVAVRGFSVDTPCSGAGAGGGGAGGVDESGSNPNSTGASGQSTPATKFVPGAVGGAGTAGAGTDGGTGTAVAAEDKPLLKSILSTLLNAYSFAADGGQGGTGWSTLGTIFSGGAGGAGGKSGGLLILIAPVITISSSGRVDCSGQDGAPGGTNAPGGAGGGGGGGAGGTIFLVAPSVTNAGTLNVDGGNGGAGGASFARPGGGGGGGAGGYFLTINPTA